MMLNWMLEKVTEEEEESENRAPVMLATFFVTDEDSPLISNPVTRVNEVADVSAVCVVPEEASVIGEMEL